MTTPWRQPPLFCARPAIATVLLLAGTLLVVSCASGSEQSDLEEIEEVIGLLEESFIDSDRANRDQLTQAAIEGIIDYLDEPYTSYLTQSHFDHFDEQLRGDRGNFEGIGAEVIERDGQVMILGPLPGSPADQAGLRPGDIVLEVDGRSLEGINLFDAVNLIRGPKDSEVILHILRAGDPTPFDVPVVRDTIELISVFSRIHEPGVGYIRVDSFDAEAARLFKEAIERLTEQGARGLVLDLRNNAGGLVDAAVSVVSEFVQSGRVFIWQELDGEETPRDVTGSGTAYDLPLVVLVNSFSASASEIVAGAIQDNGRGVVVGTTTFGKGSVNVLNNLESGAGLYVTIARWLTPSGWLIEGNGIQPDVVVGTGFNVQAAQRVSALARTLCAAYNQEREELQDLESFAMALEDLCGLRSVPPVPASEGDAQLAAAVAELRKQIG